MSRTNGRAATGGTGGAYHRQDEKISQRQRETLPSETAVASYAQAQAVATEAGRLRQTVASVQHDTQRAVMPLLGGGAS
jgi:hypothetical protein